MVKCPYCPKKFQTHHGLGGHLSGPCGLKLKASKVKASKPKPKSKSNAWLSAPSGTSMNYKLKPKPKPKPKRKPSRLKPTPVKVNFGPKMNAELRAEDLAKAQAAIPDKLANEMRKLAAAHRAKAEELEEMADHMRFLA